MIRPPPISTRPDTLFPYTTLFRSELPTAPVEPRITGLKAILTGGLNDDWVKADHVRETAERFRLSGADVGEYIQPIKDHGMGADEIALFRDTLLARFERTPQVPTLGPRHQPPVPKHTPTLQQ